MEETPPTARHLLGSPPCVPGAVKVGNAKEHEREPLCIAPLMEAPCSSFFENVLGITFLCSLPFDQRCQISILAVVEALILAEVESLTDSSMLT